MLLHQTASLVVNFSRAQVVNFSRAPKYSGMDARQLMASGRPGDLALAMLASGGAARLSEIAKRAGELKGGEQ